MPAAGHFEGGDFNILEPGFVLIGWNGERSEREGSEQVAAWVREQGWEAVVAPISREFVHMDGLVVPLAPKLLVACVDALEDWLVTLLRARGFQFVEVGYAEAKKPGRQPRGAWQRSRAFDAWGDRLERANARLWGSRSSIPTCRCSRSAAAASIACAKRFTAKMRT